MEILLNLLLICVLFYTTLKLNLCSLGFTYLSHKTHSMKFSWKLPNLTLVEIWTFIDLKANFTPQKCLLMCGLWPLVILWWEWAVSMDCSGSTESAAAAAKSLQSRPTLCDPIDGSPPGSSVHGILQARTLEWVAISSSNAWKWSRSVVSDS